MSERGLSGSGRVAWAALLLPLAVGCSGAAPPQKTNASPPADKAPTNPVKVASPDKPKAQEPVSARVPSRAMLDLLRRGPLAMNTAASSEKESSSSLPEGGKGDVRENYRAVAPATVIIRTPNGLGTGVIINHTGWILTNNHVVADGEREDFKIKVSVELGRLEKGVMERTNKSITAYVHKTDPMRDLAIVKLEGTYKDLPFIRPAAKDPTPGEPVASLGHAGSGLVWAIKDGEVAAVGKLSTHLSQLVSLECTPSEDAEDRGCKSKHQMFDGLKKVLDHDKPLQVVQSTCPNWPGDSGGPLVNRANELVGLNSFGYGNEQNRSTFHVHVSEIRSFLEEIPVKPADVVPDPWFDGGEEATIEDADLDGQYDVLRTEGRSGFARFFDLDQNSLANTTGKPDVAALYGKRSFDAEAIYLATSSAGFAWYDTDDDGKFDVMLHDEGGNERVSHGYRVTKDGHLKRDDALGSGGPMIQPDLMAQSDKRKRLAELGAVTLGLSSVELKAPLEQSLPDPLLGGGRDVEVFDFDGDRSNDFLRTKSVYSRGVVLDLDQNSLAEVRKNDAARELLEKKSIDAEMTIVIQGQRMWVYYDRNDDGKFDFVTATSNNGTGVALEAFRINENGQREPAPEHIGRKVLRPKLLQSGPLQSKLTRFLMQEWNSSLMSAIADDGIDSFPDPLRHGGIYYSFGDTSTWSKGFGAKTGWDKAILVAAGMSSSGLAIDINRDSPSAGKQSAEEVVDGGKFKADFAFLHRDGVEWTYYDSDGDGKYDVVLFSSRAASGEVEKGYRIDASGAVTLDPALAGGKMVRWSIFTKKPSQAQFKKLAAEIFQARALEP